MIRIFIGYDKRESIAYHVLCHSLLSRSSIPLSITPINRNNLNGIFDRPRGELDSTDFSVSRFIVPYLCNFEDWAIFMDCDMLCLADIAELEFYMTQSNRLRKALFCVPHNYVPAGQNKFLGHQQTNYKKKNWTSFMLINCAHAYWRTLGQEAIEGMPGLNLHQFVGLEDKRIGYLDKGWNYLVGEENQSPKEQVKMVHFTRGGPWFDDYMQCEFSKEWFRECQDMIGNTKIRSTRKEIPALLD